MRDMVQNTTLETFRYSVGCFGLRLSTPPKEWRQREGGKSHRSWVMETLPAQLHKAWVNSDSHHWLCQAFLLLVNSNSFWYEERVDSLIMELDPYAFMIKHHALTDWANQPLYLWFKGSFLKDLSISKLSVYHGITCKKKQNLINYVQESSYCFHCSSYESNLSSFCDKKDLIFLL